MSTVTRSGDPYAGAAEVLFSGCQPGELSYEQDGHGIFTLSATRVLAECPPGTSHEAYHQRVLELMRGEARQNPGFYCDPALATRTLLTAFT